MTKKIFKSSILVAAAVLIFGIACVMAILYQHFGKQINTELKKEATYLVYGVEENGIDYLKQIKEKDDRITYIAEDGTVLYDNQADAATMENHGDRKEIQEALKTGSGHAEYRLCYECNCIQSSSRCTRWFKAGAKKNSLFYD